MSELMGYALEYAQREWSILPVTGKRPTLRSWKRYQTERAPEAKLREWFARDNLTGLAVVCGPVSDGLVVRDFDMVDGYNRWAQAYPELAEVLPTVRTARGFHVYFSGDGDGIVPVDNGDGHEGELRGSGIVLLPPSKHPDGPVYRWTVPLPDGPILAVDAVLAGLLPEGSVARASGRASIPQRRQRRRSIQKQTEHTEDIGGEGSEKTAPLSAIELPEIISSTLPTGPGQRNRAVFELARALRGSPAYADADPRDLWSIVKRWHRQALSVIRTKPFDDTWFDFLEAWPKVRYPKGAGPMDVIFEQAQRAQAPPVAKRYERQNLKLLVTLCRELQRHTGDNPFYLSCRTAGQLLGVDYSTANKWLRGLESDRVLKVAERGSIKTGRPRASRFYYVAD